MLVAIPQSHFLEVFLTRNEHINIPNTRYDKCSTHHLLQLGDVSASKIILQYLHKLDDSSGIGWNANYTTVRSACVTNKYTARKFF
mmetsp:Transcript_12623/g.23667  ORF Transcript_12623/g.23667 Transcript_12623/m.23667 type:complete len:86 (-) Transcript_12623:6-263(-)